MATDTRYRLQLTIVDDEDAPLAGLRTRFTRLNSSSPLSYSLTEDGLLFRDEYYLTQTDGTIDVWITDEDGATVTVLFIDDTVAYQKDVTFAFEALNVNTLEGGGTVEAVWGSIEGTLSDQTDLQDALSGIQDDISSLQTAVGEATAWGTITGDLEDQTDLQAALDGKVTINAPVTLTGATTLNRAVHGNRQILFNGASATLTIANDASGGWTSDDTVQVHTVTGSSGVPTLATPDGKSITGSATKIIGATRKGTDAWTTGTTDPAAGGGGASEWGAITGTLSDQTDLQEALDAKATVNTPVTLTEATTLIRSTHGNRQIIFNGADATLTIASDASGGWANDDAVEVHTSTASSGVPTISTPDGKTIVGAKTKIIGATRKGTDSWTVGTTDPAAGSGSSLPNLFTGQGFMYAAARGSTAPTVLGAGGQSAVGTAAAGSGSTVAGIAFPNRHRITVATAAANTNAYCGSASGSEGVVVPSAATDVTARGRGTFIPGDGTSACRTFFGLNASTPTATVEPSTFVNCAGFGADSTDTQLFFMSNDASGSVTKIALNSGTGFPANTALADVYEWYVEIVGGATRVINYYIKNLVTGVKVTGSTNTSADIPAAGTGMRVMQYRNTAANVATIFFEYGSYAGGDWALFGATS